ncbi:armadillo-type protein [Lasiosphaeria hispida]|uniref:Armadillo-type protein n=1 Tax=Lasiosphaeria hispida TaxID=260671 RepID=A0AAJ0H8H0_9PEZI|nr:armadillo-type protein [Lasiosphaeria hispida]
MARIQSSPILSQIRVARSYSEQTVALRALKDEVIGHVQRKEKWIENGIIESLVKPLQAPPVQHILPRDHVVEVKPLSEKDVVRLQSLQLLASFANGGPSFLGPLHAVGAIPAILSHISPPENPPQVILTSLRALSNITDATRLAPPGQDDTTILSSQLLTHQHISSLWRILVQNSSDMVIQEQKCVVASLISRLCKGPDHQNVLEEHGIIDALARMLATIVVSRGEVIPGAEIIGRSDGLAEYIPEPAPLGVSLALVLEAISTVIANSRFRACALLSSPFIMAVFPRVDFSPPAKETKAAWSVLEVSGMSSHRTKVPGAMDYLLPIVPITQHRSLSSQFPHFPPLGFSPSRESLVLGRQSSIPKFTGWDPDRLDSASSNGDTEADDPESPLVPWLINLVRSTEGLERVMAASVLASLFKAGFTNPEREAALGQLVVPLLCLLIAEHDKETPPAALNSAFIEQEIALDWAILEQTPEILARLVADSEYLQQAAHDCGVMKVVYKLLRESYEPMTVQSAPRPWSPSPDHDTGGSEGLPTCRIGSPGQLPVYAHKIKMRESTLKLIAGMVTFKDEYRKELADQEMVPYVVESLSASPQKPRSVKDQPKPDKMAENVDRPIRDFQYGVNPNSVIIAACHVIRILGRSVSNLRTALEDHGVAMPIFRLLRHPDAEVQISACGAVCNLVTNSSPMREPLLDAGVLKVLCEHAHSLNPGLRLNSMWALKSLVNAVDNNLKKQALEELESGWLVQLICDDTEDEALHTRMRLERQNPNDEDEDMDTETLDDGSRPALSPSSHPGGPFTFVANPREPPRLQSAKRKVATLREAELNPTRKARNDDLAIQEQGLNFIRNLIGLPSMLMAEMVDHLFNELGQDRLFEILASKLKVKVLHAYGRKFSAGNSGAAAVSDARVLYPQAKVIEAVVYVLVHIAASIPRHRQLVIAQTELLKLLGGHLNSLDMDVRRALCHLSTNLAYQEDGADAQACQQRAMELRKLGFLAKLEGLEQSDVDLDVRERAKAAVWQLKSTV